MKPGMKVLDAGCGTGAVTRRMALRVHPEEALGVDIDPVFIEEAGRLAASQGVGNVRFERGDINHLRYGDDTFDVSYCRLVLMHVDDPVRAISELKRVTRRGGLVAASDYDDGAMLISHAPKFFDM